MAELAHQRLSLLLRACRAAFGLGVCATSSCVGTPTPEPPDFLSRPDSGKINQSAVPEVGTSMFEPVEIEGEPGAVAAATDLWLVNLDDPGASAVTVQSGADGSFSAELLARPGDRVRLVSRTADQHSLPLDFEVRVASAALEVAVLGDTSLPCLRVEPSQELRLGVGEPGAFTLTNACDEPVAVERAALRFGDQGFTQSGSFTSIAPGDDAQLTLSFTADAASEQADILLLDVALGAQRGRYALGVWGKGDE